MPLKFEFSTDVTAGGTPINRGMFRRLTPSVFLTTFCVLFVLAIIASLIVFTFLPIFSKAQENQVKYQVQSNVLTLIYNLPDRLAISPLNWTYATVELDTTKLSILQNLLQYQLNAKKITQKTSLTVMDANIVRQTSASNHLFLVSPTLLDNDNRTVIIITQPDGETMVNSTNQLIISLMLRYALECTKRCRTDLKESIFAKTFHSIEIPIDTFQLLFTNDIEFSTTSLLSMSSTLSTSKPITQSPCLISVPPPPNSRSSLVTAKIYEAESSLNQFKSSMLTSCAMCSGGQKITRIGFANELVFQQISSAYGGLTTIILYYTTDRMRFAEINVNDQLPTINITFPAMNPNENLGLLSFLVNLCQGSNTIRIGNQNDYTPDFDRMIVY